MKKTLCAALLCVAALTLSGCDRDATANSQASGAGAAAKVPNPAMSQPDEVAWSIFVQAVAPAGGKGTTFETWPSDHDTFTPGAKPIDPAAAPTVGQDQLDLKPPVIPSARSGDLAALSPPPAGHAGLRTAAAAAPAPAAGLDPPIPSPAPPGLNPGGANNNGCDNSAAKQPFFEPACDPGTAEEVRRNVPAYNYIVNNQLNSRSGLIKAYNANFYVNFPADSLEVKMNWLPAELLPTYYPGIPKDHFYIATDMVPDPNNPSKPAAKEYALIAMHVISKEVPNWTWATFEHHGNRGRCDFLGCSDDFGSTTAYVPPADNDGANQGTVYAACTPTPALQAMFKSAGVSSVFLNYCLKGSQTDFTDATGLAVRVGNSVTENGFVTQASCMTCHGMANISAQGQATTPAGFINGNAQVGPVDPSLYWAAAGGQPAYYLGQPGLTRTAIAADFVWSIPFCAYDDVTDPTKPALRCQSK